MAEVVTGKTYSNDVVLVDGTYFKQCIFEDCTFVFHGSAGFGFKECSFGTLGHEFLDGAHAMFLYMIFFDLATGSRMSQPFSDRNCSLGL